MLTQLAATVEKLQSIIEERGGDPKDLEIEVRCKSISNWAILDLQVEQELVRSHPEMFLERPHTAFLVPSLLTWKDVPIRITYGDKI
jgi:hypothetical protein